MQSRPVGLLGRARQHWIAAAAVAAILGVVLVVSVAGATAADGSPPWLRTELEDYAPGETVVLFGGDWQPGATVHVFVDDILDRSWQHNGDAVADEHGELRYEFTLPPTFVAEYEVTGTDTTNGVDTAYTTFRDSLAPSGPTVNGGTAPVTVGPGDPVPGGLTTRVTSDAPATAWRSTGWRIGSSSGCADTPNYLATQTATTSLDMVAPTTPGSYGVELRPHSDDVTTPGTGCTQGAAAAATLANAVVVDADVLFSEYFGSALTPRAAGATDVPFWKDENQSDPADCTVAGPLEGNFYAALSRGCTISTTNENSRSIDASNRRNLRVKFTWGKNFATRTPPRSGSLDLFWKPESSATWTRACQTGQTSCASGTVSNIGPGTAAATQNAVDVSLPESAAGGRIDLRFQGNAFCSGMSSGTCDVIRVDGVRVTGDYVPRSQSIAFPAIADRTYGDGAFDPGATASSGLPVSYSVSSGPCSVTGAGMIAIDGAGSCTILADQAGDAVYAAAPQVQRMVTIRKAAQGINVTTSAPASKVYGGTFVVAATGGTSGNPIVYSSAGACSNTGATFTMTSGSGTCTVRYDQAGGANHDAAAQVTQSVTATKAPLDVAADDKQMTYADPVPSLSYTVSGFVRQETLGTSGVTGAPVLSTTGTSASPAGPYAIAIGAGTLASANYSFTLVPGTLSVSKRHADVVYTGDNYQAVASGNATVGLSAKVSRAGALGNLALARVEFSVKRFGGATQVVAYATVDANGNAATTASVPASDDPYTVEVRIDPANGYWTSGFDVASLQVLIGSGSGRTAGGGWVADPTNDVNGKSNFGFTAQNAKTGIRGNSVFIYRARSGADSVQYVVKSNSWQGGGLTFTVNNDAARATFTGKATVQRYVNGILDAAWNAGGHTFTVDVFDGDLRSPRQPDGYAITVRNSANQVIKQLGSRTAPLTLGGGNVLVQRA